MPVNDNTSSENHTNSSSSNNNEISLPVKRKSDETVEIVETEQINKQQKTNGNFFN